MNMKYTLRNIVKPSFHVATYDVSNCGFSSSSIKPNEIRGNLLPMGFVGTIIKMKLKEMKVK